MLDTDKLEMGNPIDEAIMDIYFSSSANRKIPQGFVWVSVCEPNNLRKRQVLDAIVRLHKSYLKDIFSGKAEVPEKIEYNVAKWFLHIYAPKQRKVVM